MSVPFTWRSPRIAGADGIGLDACRNDREHFDIGIASLYAGGVVHICRRRHHGRARWRQSDLGANVLVIELIALGDDHMETIVVILPFAALMVDEVAQAFDFAAVDR